MSQIIASRRGFIARLATLVSAPAIMRVASIMPVKPMADWSILQYAADGVPIWFQGYDIYIDAVGGLNQLIANG